MESPPPLSSARLLDADRRPTRRRARWHLDLVLVSLLAAAAALGLALALQDVGASPSPTSPVAPATPSVRGDPTISRG